MTVCLRLLRVACGCQADTCAPLQLEAWPSKQADHMPATMQRNQALAACVRTLPSQTEPTVPPMEYASSAANSGGYIEYRMLLNDTRSTTLFSMTRAMPSAVSVKFLQGRKQGAPNMSACVLTCYIGQAYAYIRQRAGIKNVLYSAHQLQKKSLGASAINDHPAACSPDICSNTLICTFTQAAAYSPQSETQRRHSVHNHAPWSLRKLRWQQAHMTTTVYIPMTKPTGREW